MMDEQLQTALAQFINGAVQAFKDGADFAVAQLPDVIQQLLVWQFWYSLAVALTPIAVALCLARFWRSTAAAVRELDKLAIREAAAYDLYQDSSYRDDDHDELKRAYHAARAAKTAYGRSGLLAFRVWSSAVSAVVLVMWVIAAANLTWLQILIAPKIYLIEYAATLVGSVK